MDDKAYSSFLKETRNMLIRAHYNSVKICNRNYECRSCPLHDEKMVNSHNTRCFSVLLAAYVAKLSQAAKDIEEKGE